MPELTNAPVAPSVSPTLSAQHVSHSYRSVTALRDVSIHIPAGAVLALVGESGSGKTTLLRCFNRMVQPTDGRVHVGDTDVTTLPLESLRRGIGYVPQDGGLLPHWRVLRNVAFVPTLLGLPAPLDDARRALDVVGLSGATFGDRYPHELSGGQRQRVAIARALAAQPGVLLMDEPFGSVDAITRADLQAAFEVVRRDRNVTTLLVTHDLAEAARLADEIAVMRHGAIEQRGPVRVLMQSPATTYVADLFRRATASTRALELAQ